MFDGDLPNRPMLESVLADRNPGWVFADFAERATAAVVVSRYSFTYLGGRLDRALLDFALGRSAPVGDPLVICPADKATVSASFIGHIYIEQKPAEADDPGPACRWLSRA